MADRLLIKNVRLAFPNIFQRSVFEGKEGKYQATFLIPKDHPQFNEVVKAIKAKIAESKLKINPDKICFTDGDETEYDGFAGCWALKAGSQYRPTIIDQHKHNLAEEDGIIYAGCHVNAIVDFWVQNNQYGKRINGNLYGVQFAGEGEAFGNQRVDVTDEFGESEVPLGDTAGAADPFGGGEGGGEEQPPAETKAKPRGRQATQAAKPKDQIWG